jgi:diguanylate cyclase (GGDEF)-like protein
MDELDWVQHVALSLTAAALAATAAMYHRRYWRRPTRRLFQLIADARSGKAPIESLSEVDGGIRPLVEPIQQLLHDLRAQKQAHAQLNDEIRQRIEQRTNALQRMISSLRVQASRDPLTGLYNRRWLDQQLPAVLDQCRRERLELCALMIDMDHFKELNDTLGHAEGDALLRAFAQLVRSALREEDAAFRYGGDEFVILLPGCAYERAMELSRRLKELMRELVRPLRVDPPPRLSIGVASLADLPDPTPAKLLAAADQNLYEMKRSRPAA